MVYIYKKRIGDRTYYYLRISKKKNKKIIVKDIAYLGNSLEKAKKKLDKLPKYKEKIRKTYKTINNFFESNYYYEKVKKLKKDPFLQDKFYDIEACNLHYNAKFQKEHLLTKKEILKNFIIEFSFNTTSIEGNTITLNEARNLLDEGLTPKEKTLREIYDIQNTEKVFFELINIKKEITHKLIIDIHKKLMKNVDNRIGYRTRDIKVRGEGFKSSPFQYVKTDIDLLLKWYNREKKKLHPLVLSVLFHHKFEKIHPFMDGNGRTGRMLMNYILINSNYPPLIIKKKNRSEYLDAMKKADKSSPLEKKQEDYKELVEFVSNESISSYWDLFL